MVIRKDIIDEIRPFIGKDVIKVITGIRRCGKSTLLGQLKELIVREIDVGAPCFYLNLDDEANDKYLAKGVLFVELEKVLAKNESRRVYLFLDEIHDVEEWEKTVNSIRMRKNADIYITGSNSKLLSGELATYLTGRYVEFSLAPFSFREFLVATGENDREKAFWSYLEYGGMPFLTEIGYRANPSKRYLEDLYQAILLKDVVRRKNIRDVDLLSRIVRFVMTETGHVFSAKKIVDFLKHEKCETAPSTVLNYLRACEEAFLLTRVEREDLIGKRILSVDEKYYVMDNGLRNANVSANISRDVDQLLEVVVYREMIRRGYEVTIGRVKTQEVDFVCQKGKERIYLQVAYLMPTSETRTREFGALAAVPDHYEKLVLSMDRFDFSEHGIRHHYLPDFLCGNDQDIGQK
ncbi:MAG: ATP-binding protein [Kiritimatiellae bacterium]|nr:ATP-binding protein [Kiritimatiellia bacterium]